MDYDRHIHSNHEQGNCPKCKKPTCYLCRTKDGLCLKCYAGK